MYLHLNTMRQNEGGWGTIIISIVFLGDLFQMHFSVWSMKLVDSIICYHQLNFIFLQVKVEFAVGY